MAHSGYTKDLMKKYVPAIAMYNKSYKGYIQWNDGSINYYKTRNMAKQELRRDIAKNPRRKKNG
jgi:hypothetical protein